MATVACVETRARGVIYERPESSAGFLHANERNDIGYSVDIRHLDDTIDQS